ncbi:PAS domain S-box protein [Methylocaldum sp.]|uniref:PAS domain S-box protein n=1 Tax=Methylocaldum sp. TaxID=1969727 RepID=UPI002D3332A5|nr:PAS domain S-box protein [Methylocaldum sp.]HYE36589.1 PAS domain S-box protein [Methylocaldum sp.]
MEIKRLLGNRYAVAIGATASVTAVLLALGPVLGPPPPLSLFLIAVMVTVWRGGIYAGLVATALSIGASAFLLANLTGWANIVAPAEALRVALLLGVGVALSFGISRLRKAERQAFKAAVERQSQLNQALAERQPLEAALRERDQLLQLSQKIAQVGSFEADLTQGGRHRVSIQWHTHYGIAPETFEHSYDAWLNLVHPDDRNDLRAKIETAFAQQAPDVSSEFRIVRRNDRTVRWIDLRAVIRYDTAGRPIHITGSNIDVTERKHAEHTMAASEQRFKLLAETSARLLATDDPQAIIEDLCGAVMLQLGCDCFFHYLADDAKGRLHLNACAGISDEEIREIEWLDYDETVCGYVARDGERIVAENIQHGDDPRTTLIKSYGIHAYACHPLLVQGRVIGTLSFGTKTRPAFTAEELDLMISVTDQVAIAMQRVLAQQALRASEARFRTMVQVVPSLTLESDSEGNNTFASEQWCAYTGLSPEQSTGRGWLSALHPDDIAKVMARWNKAARTGMLFESQYRLKSVDGSYRWFIARALPDHNGDGKIARWTGSLTDIDDLVRTEEALRASEARALAASAQMRAIMQTARVAICVAHDAECRLITGNAQAHQLLGVPDEGDLSAMPGASSAVPYRLLNNGREVPGQDLPMQRVVKTGEIVEDVELEIVRADGTRRFVLSAAAPLYDATGVVCGATATFLDITERKQIEIERQKFVSFADQSTEFIGMCDLQFNPLYVNDAGLRLVGLDNMELARRTPVKEFVFPEDQEFLYEEFLPRVLREGRAEVEIRFRHFETGAALWMICNVFYIRDANGEPVGFATVSHDITERKQAQQALAAANDRLAADLDAMTRLQAVGALFVREGGLPTVLDQIVETAIAITGADRGHIQLVDAPSGHLRIVAQRGFEPPFLDFWHSVPVGQGPCGAALEWGERVIVEDVTESPIFEDAPGLQVTLQAGVRAVQSTPLLSRGGRLLGVFSTHYGTPHRPDERTLRLLDLLARQTADMIERAQTEGALKEADFRKNEFIAMLGHELRNPLAPIRNAVHLMRKLDTPNPKLRWAREVINRQVEHLTRLVDDLLDVSRIVQGKLRLQKTPVDLTALLHQAVEATKPQIEARRHSFTATLPKHPLRFEADPVRLTQMVSNLLDNANKYTPAGGRIWLIVDHAGSEVAITVRDNGEGIPSALLPHLFDVFTQAERTLDRAQGGLGLGLTIVQKIAELHGGRVEARSEGPGKGSEFIVRLPLGECEADAQPRRNAQSA